MANKYAYYLDFTIEKFLAGKELLKSMPMFFNRIYFCKKYANALWSGESNLHFSNIAIIANEDDIESLRAIIKNNFLYISEWDSIKNTTKGDYGFSFIAGNIKYILMTYDERENGFVIKSYDVDSGECKMTTFETDKKFFLDSSINASGEFVRTCAFNMEDMDDKNTKSFIAEKKKEPEMAIYDKKGYALSSSQYLLVFMILVLVIVWVLLAVIKITRLS